MEEEQAERLTAQTIALINKVHSTADALYRHQYDPETGLSEINAGVLKEVRELNSVNEHTKGIQVLKKVVDFLEGPSGPGTGLVDYVANEEKEIAKLRSVSKGKARCMKDFHTRLSNALDPDNA